MTEKSSPSKPDPWASYEFESLVPVRQFILARSQAEAEKLGKHILTLVHLKDFGQHLEGRAHLANVDSVVIGEAEELRLTAIDDVKVKRND